ncbi:hypothetical protein [Bradyrhizobium sp. WSM3983]|uniref:hypothetical protein n=1 Tax=Bradyrhizobium sp. WSM3983 TaxID=1038867 RepID=UPI000415A5BF|nr:hypothetical protein [Bradyrhizobium sp. WSM3983]
MTALIAYSLSSRAGLLLLILTVFLATALFFAPLRIDKLRRWGLLAGIAVAVLLLFQLVGGAIAGRILVYGLVDEQRLNMYRTVLTMIEACLVADSRSVSANRTVSPSTGDCNDSRSPSDTD